MIKHGKLKDKRFYSQSRRVDGNSWVARGIKGGGMVKRIVRIKVIGSGGAFLLVL